MSEVTFGQNQTPAPNAAPPIEIVATVNPVAGENIPGTTTVAPPAPATPVAPTTTAVATTPAASAPALGRKTQLIGDKIPDMTEIMLPRVNIVQNIGGLKDSFESGTLLLNRDLPLFLGPAIDKSGNVTRAGTPPVTMIVLGFRPTRYVEKVEGGAKGIIVDSEEAVTKAGGTLDYQEWNLKKAHGMKRFEPLADALVAIKRPESVKDDGTVFTFSVDGAKWTLALWGMRGTSYTAAAKKVFFTARSIGCLKAGGYPSFTFFISTKEEEYPGGRKAWIPVCKAGEPTSPELLKWVADVLNS